MDVLAGDDLAQTSSFKITAAADLDRDQPVGHRALRVLRVLDGAAEVLPGRIELLVIVNLF